MSFAKFLSTVESIGNETPENMEVHVATNDAVNVALDSDTTDAVTEMDSKMRDIDQVDTGIDSAEAAVERIAELQGTISGKLERTGSLTDFEQKAVEITHESIMFSLGLPTAQLTVESVSYDQRATSMIATLEEKGQSLMQSIVQSIKRALESVMTFVQDLIRNNYLLQRFWNKVNDQVRKVKGQVPTKQTMSDSAKTLSAGGYLAKDPMAIDFSIDEMYATAMGMMKASDVGIDMINKLNFKFSELEDRNLEPVLNFQKHGIPGVNTGEAAKTKNAYGYLVNGRSVVRVEADLFGVSKALEGIVSNGDIAETIAVATPEQMYSIMGKAEAIMKAIKSFDGKRSYIKNAISRITQYLAQDALFYPSLVSKGARSASDNLGAIRGMRKVINGIVGRFPLESFKIAKAFIDYCRNSLRYYDGSTARSSDTPASNSGSATTTPGDDRPPPATSTQATGTKGPSRDEQILALQRKFGNWLDVETGMRYPFRYYSIDAYESRIIPELQAAYDKFMRYSNDASAELDDLKSKEEIIRQREGANYSPSDGYAEDYQRLARVKRMNREKADSIMQSIRTMMKFIEEAKKIPK
jgi:hypothetical protein